ncbi:MAG TPA: MarC family protein [Polyangiales bacterium]|nr:MarC family protein [Polyangiales bacterium]
MWAAWLSTLTTLLFVVDPLAVVPLFVSMTGGETPLQRRTTARRATTIMFIALSAFALAGRQLFALLGISLGAFQIAGGALLFLLAIDMLRAQRSRTRSSPEEEAEGVEKTDVSVFPLAIPMLAGPGATSTVLVLVARAETVMAHALVVLSIAATALLCYFTLRSASVVERRLGATGMNVLERVMGLILAATAVQFMLDGLKAAFP